MSSRLPLTFVHDTPLLPAAPHDVTAESRILARVGRGETAALTDLWDVWSRPLFAVAVRALGSAEDAEEVLQDALVRFWEKAATYDQSKCQPFSWGMMILRGLIFDRLRKRQCRPQLVSGHTIDQEFPAIGFSVPGEQMDLETALATLSPEEREALHSAVFEPATHEAIALRLSQPLGTVKSRIRSALTKLRAALVDDAPPGKNSNHQNLT
jgi:RNA polymerase sigma-70 factor, ECF subfamily